MTERKEEPFHDDASLDRLANKLDTFAAASSSAASGAGVREVARCAGLTHPTVLNIQRREAKR